MSLISFGKNLFSSQFWGLKGVIFYFSAIFVARNFNLALGWDWKAWLLVTIIVSLVSLLIALTARVVSVEKTKVIFADEEEWEEVRFSPSSSVWKSGLNGCVCSFSLCRGGLYLRIQKDSKDLAYGLIASADTHWDKQTILEEVVNLTVSIEPYISVTPLMDDYLETWEHDIESETVLGDFRTRLRLLEIAQPAWLWQELANDPNYYIAAMAREMEAAEI